MKYFKTFGKQLVPSTFSKLKVGTIWNKHRFTTVTFHVSFTETTESISQVLAKMSQQDRDEVLKQYSKKWETEQFELKKKLSE